MKRNFLVLFLIVLGCIAADVSAQQYSFIPTGTVANNIPWGSGTNRRQNLYYPTNFNAPSGSITTLYIKPNTAIASISFTNVTISMGPTALNTFVAGPWATGLTTVFNGPATFTANAGGWLVIPLTTPYAYNNTQNLIVDFQQTGNSATISVLHDNTASAADRSLYAAATAGTAALQPRLQQLGFDMVACTAPSGLAAAGITATSANLSWGAVPASTGYQYAVTTSSTPPASGTATTGTTYNAPGLTPATTYYLHVKNICSPTSSSGWTTFSFTTLAACAAPSPAVISGITTTGASANWTAVPGSTGYEWFVSTSSTPPASGTANPGTSQPITGLTVGTQYYFHLRNVCTGGLFSSWVSTSFSTPCNPVTGLSVSSVSFNGATLSWTAVPGSAGYEWVATTSPTPPASGTAATGTTVNATGLLGGTLYYVHVRNNCGAAGFSGWTTTTFTTSSSCTSPSNILITNIGTTDADIQWDAVPGAIGFEYLVDNTPQAPTMSGSPIAFNSYSPANLVSATRYYVHLRTNCGPGGFSPWVTVQFTTDTLCFAPVAVIDEITGTTANISWQPEPNAVNYQYLVSTHITPPFSGYATTATNYVAKGLQKNTQYYMHLRAYCGGNDISSWRSTGFVTNEQSTSISGGLLTGNRIHAYPNPVTELLTVTIEGAKPDGTLSLVDVTGKTVWSKKVNINSNHIPMSELAGGVYFVRYVGAGEPVILKILKH